MATVLIKNGRIVTAVDDYQADLLIEDGRIHTIGQGLVVGEHVETHDASGLLVLPGGVDVHTHLDWDFGAHCLKSVRSPNAQEVVCQR
jgi:dihydropyrimidinase